jgi:hypothetical protein
VAVGALTTIRLKTAKKPSQRDEVNHIKASRAQEKVTKHGKPRGRARRCLEDISNIPTRIAVSLSSVSERTGPER